MEFFSNILLTEGARDRALELFIPYFQKRGIDMSVSKLKQFLLNKFVTEAIPWWKLLSSWHIQILL